MPKKFTDREQNIIKGKLFEEGKILFSKFGIRKTTVDEIVKAAGISKGSFYIFYNSKEDLFFDILESLDKESKGKLSGNIFPDGRSYKESFKIFLKDIFETIEKTPFLTKINPAELEYLMRKLPSDKIESHLNQDSDYFNEFFEIWQKKGMFKDTNPKGFSGTLKLIFYFVLHKAEYSSEEFLATKELLINMLCEYLVNE